MSGAVDHNAVFRTYHNYLRAIDRYLRLTYGREDDLFLHLAEAFSTMPTSGRIKKVSVDGRVERSLRQAWATEVFIHHQSETAASAEVISCANLWATVQAYYSVFHAAQAVIQGSRWWNSPPDSHAGTLKLLSEATSRPIFPPPFDAFCKGPIDTCTFGGMLRGVAITNTNSLAVPTDHDCHERIGLLLKTTRERQIAEVKQKWIDSRENRKPQGGKYRRVPAFHQAKIAERIPATTLFDFLYRFRIRSNYRDAEAFLLGAGGQSEGMAFNEALINYLQATLFVLELVLSRIMGVDELVSSAKGFMEAVGDPAERTVGARLPYLYV
ncbi:MAG: hypothetical protein M3Q03_17870 [Chloroflexota bacterium]|nr:hypothetical protein [Chloroflexota bacterium]